MDFVILAIILIYVEYIDTFHEVLMNNSYILASILAKTKQNKLMHTSKCEALS